MWANMVVFDICELLHCFISLLLYVILMEIYLLILQCVEITLHRCIIIGISGFAHALCNIMVVTVFDKSFRRILHALI